MAKPSKKTSPDFRRIFNYIAETGMLMQMPRSHKRHLGTTFDTVSSHSHHVAIIAYCLARLEGLTHQQGLESMAMGVLHDNAEARTNDLDFLAKHYASTNEEKAINDQLKDLPFSDDLKKLIHEYEQRESLTAKCAKDADTIDQLYQQWMMMYQGNKMAERWHLENYQTRVPYLRTESAKQLAYAMIESHPHEWWFNDVNGDKLNLDLLNGKK